MGRADVGAIHAATNRLMVVRIAVTGFRELRDKLNRELLGEPWREVMQRMGERGLTAARAASPVRTGRMRAAFTTKLANQPIPLKVEVLTTARATATSRKSATVIRRRYGSEFTKTGRKRRQSWRNYSYPKRLEFDPNSRYFGWLRDVGKSLRGELVATINIAAKKIEAAWGK